MLMKLVHYRLKLIHIFHYIYVKWIFICTKQQLLDIVVAKSIHAEKIQGFTTSVHAWRYFFSCILLLCKHVLCWSQQYVANRKQYKITLFITNSAHAKDVTDS